MKEEHLKILMKVAKRFGKKFTFSYYTEEDIEQEAILIGLNAYSKWDGERPLENFLMVSIKNRLISFKRTNLGNNPEKQNVIKPIDYEIINPDGEPNLQYSEPDKIVEDEMMQEIDEIIPGYLREYYLKMLEGLPVPHNRRTEIRDIIGDYFD